MKTDGLTARPSPGTRVASYVIIRKIASGGQAEIYEAKHRLTRKRVAIKLLKDPSSESAVERFRMEANLALGLQHKNLYTALKFGTFKGTPFLVMAYLNGVTLSQLIGGGRYLPVFEAISITRQALAGLQALHDSFVVHRDLKPSNIFIHCDKGHDTVKLLDLGISKELTGGPTSRTRSTMPIGTPHYMAPERMNNETTVQSDIYAMGVILYEAVTGVRPLDGSPHEVRAKIVGSALARPPSQINESVSHELDEIILKAMARDPVERFQTAEGMRLALEGARLTNDGTPNLRSQTADIARTTSVETKRPHKDPRNHNFPFWIAEPSVPSELRPLEWALPFLRRRALATLKFLVVRELSVYDFQSSQTEYPYPIKGEFQS